MYLHFPPKELDGSVEELEGECGQLGEHLHGMVGRLEDHLPGTCIQMKSKLMQFVRVHGEFEGIQPPPDRPHGVIPVPLVSPWWEADAFKQLKSKVGPPVH